MIAGIPSRMVDALFGYAKEADAKGASASASAAGGGQLGAWIAQAIAATHVPGSWAGPLRTLVMRESGGNPRAINLSDSNAKAGDPSRGLMQTIGSTFEHYRLKGLPDDIFNPIANLAAGIRYILSRYGTIFNVQQANARLTSKGYASGTSGAARGWAWVGERGPELVNFGGGETVLPHGQSLRTAAALGALGGYATGTASARKAVPGDLGGFTKSLVGSASSIADAAKTLAADLLAAGGAGKALATRTGQVSAKLQSLATARDALAATIAAAKQFAADQAQNARDYLGLSNLGDTTSVGGLISGLTTRQDTVKAFKGEVDTAAKHGASKDLISQLIGLGPDSGLTQLVAGASAAQLKQLNALIASGGKLATSYGNDFADQMYDTGADAGKGFLVGLQDQEKALQAEMTKLGSGLVASIRKALDSHSPAQKLVAVGHDVGAGLAIGVDDTTSAVAAAAARMADAAAPAPAPAQLPASTARSAASGLASRTPVRLVVGDREFTAYLEEVADGRVDSALIKVRRRAGAGHKG
jgi:SLT domain-containing protein